MENLPVLLARFAREWPHCRCSPSALCHAVTSFSGDARPAGAGGPFHTHRCYVVGDHLRPDGVALHRSHEVESMPVLLALRHDVMPLHRS